MAQVLRVLPPPSDPNLLVGMDHLDDAGVYAIGPSTALVQTIDFFAPLVDDPYTYGRIAAANSLSDVYAMGGRPITAMNILCFPDETLPIELAAEIIRGGNERVTAAGAVTVGGHSVRDAEVKYGLAVTGLIDPRRIVTNAGARPGDVLLLTKPLGTGVLASAFRSGRVDESGLAEAVETMTDLNVAASLAMVEVGVHACTDITGFGLLGHALEMATAGGVSLEFEVSIVPLLGGVLELARKRQLTRSHRATLEHVGAALYVEPGVEDVMVKVLADAQTSGGLLIALPADRNLDFQTALARHGGMAAATIGRVLARAEYALRLR